MSEWYDNQQQPSSYLRKLLLEQIQSPIWRAIAAPTITPIPFAMESPHDGSR